MIILYSLPPNPPKRFESESTSIVLGRSRKSDQPVDLDLTPDSYVSKRHTRISYENNEYWIEDLKSGNGTWVDGEKITTKTRLTPDSKVRVGWTIIEVQMEAVREKDEQTDLESTRDKAHMETEPPVSVEEHEPVPEGIIVPEPDVGPEHESPEDEMPDQAWHQLKALNNFCSALETAGTLDSLSEILVNHLQKAIPGAQRGAVLLPDERGELLLKAHWPHGDHSVSMTWVKRAFARREAFIWAASPSAEESTDSEIPHSAIYYDVRSAIYVPLLLGGDVLGVMYVDNYYTCEAFSPTDLELLKAIANQVAMFLRDHVLRKDLQREEALRSNLLRQFSPKVAEHMLEKCQRLQRGGERLDPVTILVSDVRNFTALSAKLEPDNVVRMLNEMFDAFVPIISEHDGIVDKYVGDSVLAVFGSPEPDAQQWEKAVQAALKMQQAIRMIAEGSKVRRMPVFRVGIGIHTGEVIHGFIGSSERIEFTVIGDTVNRAARYCDGAGPDEIVISDTVYERVYSLVDVQPKTIKTKHPDVEPDLEAYLVEGLKQDGMSA